MKLAICFLLILLFYNANSQANKKQLLKTSKYAGVYSFGENVEKGAVGSVFIYPETDSTVLFFIDVCRGAPSYNLGQLYDRLKIVNGKGIYFSNKYDNSDTQQGCKLQLTIHDQILTIKTLDNAGECGFGGNVTADNEFRLKDKKKPTCFIDGHNHKIFFSETSPENYLK